MKRLGTLALLLTVLCIVVKLSIPIFSINTATAAEEINGPSITLLANEKKQFALDMNIAYENDKDNKKSSQPSVEEINKLLLQIPLTNKEKRKAINAKLASYGVYEYKVSEIAYDEPSNAANITLSAPAIYYSAWEASWIIVCGGTWTNDTWNNDVGYVGLCHRIDEVGDADTFGVTLLDNDNTYHSYVMRTSAYITDAEGQQRNLTQNRSNLNSALGFCFRLQDYIYQKNSFNKAYVGYAWSGLCTYDTNFEEFEGKAKTYYIHTYDTLQN